MRIRFFFLSVTGERSICQKVCPQRKKFSSNVERLRKKVRCAPFLYKYRRVTVDWVSP